MAMKSVPAEKTKSPPMAEAAEATKAYAQYVVDGSIIAKRRQAVVVAAEPTPAPSKSAIKFSESQEQRAYEPYNRDAGGHEAYNYVARNPRHGHR